MPGFLQCKSYLPHTEHIFSFKFFHLEESDHSRVFLWRRPSADPHLLVHFIQQRQRSITFFQWAQRGQLAQGGIAFPLLMPVFPIFDRKDSILLESPQFSETYSYPFLVKYTENGSAQNVSLLLETDLWSDPFMTLVFKWTWEGLHLQSLLTVTS